MSGLAKAAYLARVGRQAPNVVHHTYFNVEKQEQLNKLFRENESLKEKNQELQQQLTKLNTRLEQSRQDVELYRVRHQAIVATEDMPTISTRVKIADILSLVAREYNITEDRILEPAKTEEVKLPRAIVMHLAQRLTGYGWLQIGQLLKRDRTTVLSGARRVATMRVADALLDQRIANMERELKAAAELASC